MYLSTPYRNCNPPTPIDRQIRSTTNHLPQSRRLVLRTGVVIVHRIRRSVVSICITSPRRLARVGWAGHTVLVRRWGLARIRWEGGGRWWWDGRLVLLVSCIGEWHLWMLLVSHVGKWVLWMLLLLVVWSRSVVGCRRCGVHWIIRLRWIRLSVGSISRIVLL